MAINFTDFSRAPLLDSPAASIFEDVLKGYKMSQEPAKMREEQSARVLANKLKDLEVQHKPKQFELDDRGKALANSMKAKALEHFDEKYALDKQYKQAQIASLTKKGLQSGMNLTGAVKNAEAIYQLEHSPDADPEHVKALKDAYNAEQEHVKAVTNRSKDITAGNQFDKLPVNDKKREIGLMSAMGVDPVKAVSYLRQSGNDATKYAEENGINIADVTPKYALGEQNIKDVQRTSAYFDELGSLEQNISRGMAKYPNRLKGYSLEMIADQLQGDKPEEVGEALAAAALQPELASLRLKVQGGNIGIEAIRELTNKSLGKLNTVEALVDKPTYEAMQNYINKWLKEAGEIRIRTLENYGRLTGALKKGGKSNSDVMVFNPATGRLE